MDKKDLVPIILQPAAAKNDSTLIKEITDLRVKQQQIAVKTTNEILKALKTDNKLGFSGYNFTVLDHHIFTKVLIVSNDTEYYELLLDITKTGHYQAIRKSPNTKNYLADLINRALKKL